MISIVRYDQGKRRQKHRNRPVNVQSITMLLRLCLVDVVVFFFNEKEFVKTEKHSRQSICHYTGMRSSLSRVRSDPLETSKIALRFRSSMNLNEFRSFD